jgi:hypothetical protein
VGIGLTISLKPGIFAGLLLVGVSENDQQPSLGSTPGVSHLCIWIARKGHIVLFLVIPVGDDLATSAVKWRWLRRKLSFRQETLEEIL